jgi:hypothetical protein
VLYVSSSTAGRVGINTQTPTHDLSVVGTISASSYVGDGTGLTGFPVQSPILTASNHAYTRVVTYGLNSDTIDASADLKFTATGELQVGSTGVNIVRLNKSGYVIISGSTRIGNESLAVVGQQTIRDDGAALLIKATTAGVSSYMDFQNSNASDRGLFGVDGTQFSGATGRFIIATWTNTALSFMTNQAHAFTINSSNTTGRGYVALGHTRSVSASGSADHILHIKAASSAENPDLFKVETSNAGAAFIISGSTGGTIIRVGIGTSPNYELEVNGEVSASTYYGDGSNLINVVSSDTASYIETAQTASYVETAQTASYVETAQTASYVSNAISASYSATASYVLKQNTLVNTPSYTALQTDYRLRINYSLTGSTDIQLPLISDVGSIEYRIKDEDGNASTNNINILASGSNYIDGETTQSISVNYGAVSLYNDGSENWYIE